MLRLKTLKKQFYPERSRADTLTVSNTLFEHHIPIVKIIQYVGIQKAEFICGNSFYYFSSVNDI